MDKFDHEFPRDLKEKLIKMYSCVKRLSSIKQVFSVLLFLKAAISLEQKLLGNCQNIIWEECFSNKDSGEWEILKNILMSKYGFDTIDLTKIEKQLGITGNKKINKCDFVAVKIF